jgi:hypothetical protein
MPEARFELARGCPRWILSPLRLPFRHSGRAGNIASVEEPGKPEAPLVEGQARDSIPLP